MGRSFITSVYAEVKFKAVLIGYDVKEYFYGARADCCDPDIGGGWQDPTQAPMSTCCVVESFCRETKKTPVFEIQTFDPVWRLESPRASDGGRMSFCMWEVWGQGNLDQSEVDAQTVSELNDLIAERERSIDLYISLIIAPDFESNLGECKTPPNGSHHYEPAIPHGICFWDENYTLISEKEYREEPPPTPYENSLEDFNISYFRGPDVEVETECED